MPDDGVIDARPADEAALDAAPPPMAMLAELTHRCPLKCPYCSNPLDLVRRSGELSTDEWRDVFAQAAAMGVLQAHLSGGEPAARRDLPEIVSAARDADLYANLITSGVGLTETVFHDLVARGLDHVQLSIQGVDAASADRIGGYAGGFDAKMRVAEWVAAAGVPLTVNAVMHRQNLDRLEETIDLALRLGARRLEIAHTQYHGWAYRNRAALMPTAEQVKRAGEIAAEATQRLMGVMAIDYVTPDHLARRRGLHRLSRHALDARSLQKLRPPHKGLGRLPLSGVRLERRRGNGRSGVLQGAQPRRDQGCGAGGGRRARRRLRLSRALTGRLPQFTVNRAHFAVTGAPRA